LQIHCLLVVKAVNIKKCLVITGMTNWNWIKFGVTFLLHFFNGFLCKNPVGFSSITQLSEPWLASSALKDTFQNCCFSLYWVRGIGPAYFSHVVHAAADIESGLRSAVRGDLFVPQARTAKLDQRSISVAALVIWNSLPLHLRSQSISRRQFQAGLNTHLFKEAYIDNLWELLLKSDLNWTELNCWYVTSFFVIESTDRDTKLIGVLGADVTLWWFRKR